MKKLFILCLFSFAILSAKPVRVYVDVVGDLFHAGHVQFFKKAKAEGDVLIVGVHSDADVLSYKRLPYLTMEERAISIRGCRYVDEVLVNAPLGVTKEWIEEHEIDLVIHGDDFSEDLINSQYSVPIKMGIFKTVPYTKGISTTDIIRRVEERLIAKQSASE